MRSLLRIAVMIVGAAVIMLGPDLLTDDDDVPGQVRADMHAAR